jgi:hypothetical protein
MILLVVSGCGKKDEKAKGEQQESVELLVEGFSLRGCSTPSIGYIGRKDKAKESICSAIQRPETNNYCAAALRKKYFAENCSGYTWASDEYIEPLTYSLQFTIINFLNGYVEPCDVKNKIFTFSITDKNERTTLCKNSAVEIYAVSNAAVVNIFAQDLVKNITLDHDRKTDMPIIVLGKLDRMLAVGYNNPYGFTYLMAEDFTGVDLDLVAAWNSLSTRYATLKAELLDSEANGHSIPQDKRNELAEIVKERALLSEKINKQRVKVK